MLLRQVALAALLPCAAVAQTSGVASGPAIVLNVQGQPGPKGDTGAAGPTACGQGSLDANCMVKSASGLITNPDGSVVFAQPVLTAVSNTPSQIVQTDHLGVTTARGIANRSSNVSYSTPATGATVTVAQGTAYVILTGSGTVASQPVQLPTSPLDGDQAVVSTGPGLTVTAAQMLGVKGTQIALAMMRPMTSMALLYEASVGDWVPRLMPATLYGDTQAVAAVKSAGFAISVNGNPADSTGNVTLALPTYALPPATTSVLGGVKQGANTTIASDGTLSVGVPYTDAQALAAAKAGLGSAAQAPTSAFDASGAASTEATRAQGVEATKAPLASPAFTGTPTAPTQTAGDATAKLATDAFVQTAIAAIPACPAASATVAGCVKSTMALDWTRTTSPISATVNYLAVSGVSLLAPVNVTVPGVQQGDFVEVSFATTPTNITISAAQVTAANTVQIVPEATGALALGSQNLSLNFAWSR